MIASLEGSINKIYGKNTIGSIFPMYIVYHTSKEKERTSFPDR